MANNTVRLTIVRHGTTPANAAGLLQGRVDNPLNEEGHAQAQQIAAGLTGGSLATLPAITRVPITRIIASPLSRTISTATPLAEANSLTIETDERWIELSYGDWEQRPAADVSPEEWRSWRGDPHFALPGGESLMAVEERVRAACEELAADPQAEHVAVFTHVSPIKASIGWALGVDPLASAAMSWRMHVAQAQISSIALPAPLAPAPPAPAIPSAPARLLEFNSTSHLTS